MKSNPLSSSPQYVGIAGGFDLPFQPQGREIDYWLGQIPTISPPSPYWGVRLNIDRCITMKYSYYIVGCNRLVICF